MKYSEAYMQLTYETATVVFFKTNGEVRIMLATRNISTSSINHGFLGSVLSGHDNRCNIKNGNVAVIDLILGESRSFNIDRLISFESHGAIDTKEKMDEAYKKFKEFKEEYEKTKPMKLSVEALLD